MEAAERPSLAGRTISHYRISTVIGAGGMGEVYRATDTNLGREVALKVLPADMARDADRLARFQREARAVAALNHPNVVTIYSVEETEELQFITMELIEGQPLDQLVPAGGMALERIVEIASVLAEALAAAHEKGIVHRDLKPANVMVTNEGRVKVLDFGLAKDLGAANANATTVTSLGTTSAGLTQAGMVMGTPAYMSPEQVSGRPLDHRTDIFSLGVLLHEMATGSRPFEGASSAELISSILRDQPAAVTDVRPDLPADLARVIRRCLEKDPRHRVQTARDVGNEFRELGRAGTRTHHAGNTASRAVAAADSGASRAAEGFWVAVLPFKYTGSNEELKSLAEGISDEVVTGLARFSYLRVVARGSTSRYSSESGDVRAIGKELGARYVMEGSIRQAGNKLRLAVQLTDTTTGTHLWAENYERSFNPEAIFDLQDDLVPRIVSTAADYYGILPHSICDALRRRKADDQLSPYEAVLRAFSYFERITPEEHAQVREILERAARSAPDQGEIWAMLSTIYWHEHALGFNAQPDPLGRALAAARRSIDVAPTNNLGYSALATVLYLQKDLLAFRAPAERAIELNPMDGSNLAHVGLLMAQSGDWERGCALAESALRLNPHHPGWYWFVQFLNAYRKGEYQDALTIALKINLPGYFLAHAFLAAVYGQLGMREPAQKALKELLALRPDFAAAAGKEFKLDYHDAELVERLMDGLRKAGLKVQEAGAAVAPALSSSVSSSPAPSGESRAAEGFWVAVLPFKYAGSNEDLKSLAEGISDEVITGFSRFSYLRVVARGSTAKYSSEPGEVRAIGKELGARYVLEGNLRQAGSKLRLAVQLTDTTSGTHLWAETYEHTFSPDSVFEVQDDLVPRIVSTVGDPYGVLPRSMSELLRNKSDDELSAYEAVLSAFGYYFRVTPEEYSLAVRRLEHAVHQFPDHADSWAMLAFMYRNGFVSGFDAGRNLLDRALAAAQRAVDLAPANALCHFALATVHFFRKETVGFRAESEKALALNPLDSSILAYLGQGFAVSGEWDRGCQMVELAMQRNANLPGAFYSPVFWRAYRQGRYEEALQIIARANTPGYFHMPAAKAAALGQLGRREEAQKAVQDLLALRPDFAAAARLEYGKFFDAELVEHAIDGLRKAGLEIPDAAPVPNTSGQSAAGEGSGKTRSGAERRAQKMISRARRR